VLAQRRAAVGPAALGPARERRDEPVGQHAVDLVQVRLEEIGHDDLPAVGPFFPRDPLEAVRPCLELRHADGVLVAHPHREVAGDRSSELEVAALDERPQTPQVLLGVGAALVVDETRERRIQDGA